MNRYFFFFPVYLLYSLPAQAISYNPPVCIYENNTKLTTYPNGVSVSYEFDDQERLRSMQSSDGSIHYTLEYDQEGGTWTTDQIHHTSLYKKVDKQGRILQEIFPNGHDIELFYEEDLLTRMRISSYGNILYEYNADQLSAITRVSSSGELLYQHFYRELNATSSKELLIGNLGQLTRSSSPEMLEVQSPFGSQTYLYDKKGNLAQRKLSTLSEQFYYDEQNQLQNFPIDPGVNEKGAAIDCTYDENGNITHKKTANETCQFFYDALNRLIRVITEEKSVEFTYDASGRRLSKTVHRSGSSSTETYLYFGNNQIAVFDQRGELEHLRVLSIGCHPAALRAIAIEAPSGTYAPIYDHNLTIYQLINIDGKEVVSFETLDPFAENLFQLPQITPWIYSAKYYDAELNLVYFGHRYYDPSIHLWLTKDPLGTTEEHLYSYALNNPLTYIDPDGRFVLAPVVWLTGALLKAAVTSAIVWGGYRAGKSYYKHKVQKFSEKSRQKYHEKKQKFKLARAKK